MAGLRDLFRFRTVEKEGEVLMFRVARREKMAEMASKASKEMPKKPPKFEATVARASKLSMTINLAPKAAMQVVADSSTMRTRLLDTAFARSRAAVARMLERINVREWEELFLKLASKTRTVISEYRVWRAKGILLELSVRQMPEFEQLIVRCRKKLKQVAGFHGEPFIIRGARTMTPKGMGELGDYLVIAFDDPKKPTRAWIMAIVESKSETNAIELISKEAYDVVPGEFLGQPEMDVERVKVFGLDLDKMVRQNGLTIEGVKDFEPDALRIRHQPGLAPEFQTTELIGVAPPDAKKLDYIEGVGKERGVQIWRHPITGAEANGLAKESLKIVEGG